MRPRRLLLALVVLVLTSLGLESAVAYGVYSATVRADSLRARTDTLYREVRIYIHAASFWNERAIRAEGQADWLKQACSP